MTPTRTNTTANQQEDDVLLRLASLQDIDELYQLDQKSWAAHLAADKDTIEGRLKRLPDWQFVLEKDGQICGVLYTQRIEDVEQLLQGGFQSHTTHCKPDGSILQLVSIAVDQALAPNGGNLLRNNIISKVKRDLSITRLIALTRCSTFNYHELHDQDSYKKYVLSFKDPTIFFHVSGGATVQKVAEGYRPEDKANLGNAVLIEYEAVRKSLLKIKITSAAIIEEIKKLCSNKGHVDLLGNTPILNVIDSQELMLLHGWIETEVQDSLLPDFLFRYSTPVAIEAYFSETRTAKTEANPESSNEEGANLEDPIAIVGIGFRLPGNIESLSGLWKTMENKECKSRKVPHSRWAMYEYDKQQLVDSEDKARAVELGCFLDEVDTFDHEYFNMSLPEAQALDPNHRVILESVAKAVHDSRRSIHDLNGKNIGVWVGLSNTDYHEVPGSSFKGNSSVYGATGGAASMAAGRVSYILGLNGPSSVLDTACSSSLVAMHDACNSLRLNECDEAIVAAVNLILAPWVSLAYARAGMTSPDGKCLTFDDSANGYCRGEGGGAVVLKRLSKALMDKDQVYAVVRGSAVMHHGRGASLTAPNAAIQEQLIRNALKAAKLSTEDVSFVEAHGTGTKLGDPIEVAALASVFGSNQSLLVNSVKANVGHLEAAAGLAGLFSVLAEFKHRRIAPNANLITLNSKIKSLIAGKNISFPSNVHMLDAAKKTCVAGISSFGYSGTIAHVIVESVPSQSEEDLAPSASTPAESVVWQFTGQGNLIINSQKVFLDDSAFVQAMQYCDNELKSLVGIKMSTTLYPDNFPGVGDRSVARSILDDVVYSQLLLVCLEYCIAQSLLAKGMKPAVLLGHSLGEYAAAVVGGALSLHDCLQMVLKRGQLIRDCEGCAGQMYMISATEAELRSRLDASSGISIAAVNGQDSVVLSGTECELNVFISTLDQSVRKTKLKMNRAYHSSLLQQVQQEYADFLKRVDIRKLEIPLVSTVAGYQVVRKAEVMARSYWCDHMLRTVRFYDAIQYVNNSFSSSKVIEIGPGPILTNLCKRMSAEDRDSLVFQSCGEALSSLQPLHGGVDGFYHKYRHLKCPYYDEAAIHRSKVLAMQKIPLLERFGTGLQDHVVDQKVVVPGAALIELALDFGGKCLSPSTEVLHLKDFTIMQSFVLPREEFQAASNDAGNSVARLAVDPADSSRYSICNTSSDNSEALCANFSIQIESQSSLSETTQAPQQHGDKEGSINPDTVYEEYGYRGLTFGPSYRIISSMQRSNSGASLKVAIRSADCDTYGGDVLSPTVIDAVIHAAGAMMFSDPTVNKDDLFIPFSINDIVFHKAEQQHGRDFHAEICLQQQGKDFCVFNCDLFTADNKKVLQLQGLHMRKFNAPLPSGGLYGDFLYTATPMWKAIGKDAEKDVSVSLAKDKEVTILLWTSNELDASLTLKEFFIDQDARDVSLHKVGDHLVIAPCDMLVWLLPNTVPDVAGKCLQDMLKLLGAMPQVPERVVLLSAAQEGDTMSNSFYASLAPTMQLENFRCKIQSLLVGMDDLESFDLLRGITFCCAHANYLEVMCKHGELFEKNFRTVETKSVSGSQYELHMSARGSLDNLKLRVQKHQTPRPSEVLVGVQAVSLNFRDVLNVLGMYPGDPGEPGCEFAGVVLAVGKTVSRFQVGDRVAGFATGSLKERVTISENRICKVASNLSLADAATLPVVFCTVELALNSIMRLSADDTILIHTAAGGVGLAAIQYAQRIGARIIATASDSKVDYLHSLGVSTVCSSRDAQLFRQQIKNVLGEQKVSCILNTLTDDFISASLEVLAANGSFVELGKRGVWSREEMAAHCPYVNYALVEIDTMAEKNSAEYIQLLEAVNRKFADNTLQPLQKVTFDFLQDHAEAFNCLRTGSNIGKVVLTMQQSATTIINSFPLCGKSIIITGGTGSLGVLTALDVCEMGARRIFLLSRSGTVSTKDAAQLEPFKDRISVLQCDVSREEAVVSMLQQVRSAAGGIDGIIHAAGVLRDALIRGGGAAAGCAEVWNAKAQSAWWLHEHTRKDNLQFFICFSSIVSTIGREGQAAYGVSNRFLDELCSFRTAHNLPSVAIQIPAIADVGMAADGKTTLDDWSISSSEFRQSLANVFQCFATSQASLALFPSTMHSILPDNTLHIFRDVLKHAKPKDIELHHTKNDSVKFENITLKSLTDKIESMALSFMGSGSQRITKDSNLVESGLDSLGATEFASKLSGEFGVKLPPTLVFNYPSVNAVADRLCELLPHLISDRNQSIEPQIDGGVSSETESETVTDSSSTAGGYCKLGAEVGVIGVSMTLPGSIHSLAEIRQKMHEKFMGTGEVSADRWNLDDIFNSSEHLKRRKDYLKSLKFGGFLATQELHAFKGSDFGITDLEAMKMDCRQKLALKFAHLAIQDAELDVSALKGKKVGVFVAALGQLTNSTKYSTSIPSDKPSVFDATSNSLSVISGRISYIFGFEGPCISIDTACSSSLVAMHLAKKSIVDGESDIAIVVGVNLLDPELSVSFALAGMLSPDGRCHTFDEAANGYCRGEGCGAVVLKRLSDAQRDADQIYAVIKGSAVMQDGKSASLTAPNGLAQEQLLRAALSDAGVRAKDVSYIEAHGTGTKLGDPIEVEAIAKVYGQHRSADNPLYVGSIKANIGHLEAAAGMAGVFSAISMLKHRQIAPNAHLHKLNDSVSKAVDGLHILFPQEVVEVKENSFLCATVSSFGYSGTISSIVLTSANAASPVHQQQQLRINDCDTQSSPMLIERVTQGDDKSVVAGVIVDAGNVAIELKAEKPSYHEVITKAKAVIRSVISSLQDLEQQSTVDIELVDLSDHGLDSLTATELANQLSDEFSISILPVTVVEHPSMKALVEIVLQQLNVLQDIVAASAQISAGSLYEGNPWFANYFAENAKARLVIFGGMAHPVVSWHKFVQPWLQLGITVHIVRLPGRFERLQEPGCTDSDDLVRGVCEALKELNWLTSLPLCFMGYSFGTAMAYACARYVEHELQAPIQHLVCLAGPDRAVYDTWSFIDVDPAAFAETGIPFALKDFIDYHEKNMGRMNPLFDLNLAYMPQLLGLIFAVFCMDMQTAASWVQHYDDAVQRHCHELSCNITCVNGDVDVAVRDGGWMDVTKGRYEQVNFPGDHFFVYHDEQLDIAVVQTIARSIFRGMNIYM